MERKKKKKYNRFDDRQQPAKLLNQSQIFLWMKKIRLQWGKQWIPDIIKKKKKSSMVGVTQVQ